MSVWAGATGSARGSRHTRRGEGNEDAASVAFVGDATIVAVADGHGSERCTRASTGAQFAVEATLGSLQEDPPLSNAVVAEQVVDRWRAYVAADVLSNPPTEVEQAIAEPPYHLLYGTTILAAAASTDRLRLLKLGDGDVLVGRRNAHHARLPFPPLMGNTRGQTTSLCQDQAVELMAVADYDLRKTGIDVVLLATDGLDCAFVDDGWHDQTISDMLSRLGQMHATDLPRQMEAWCKPPADTGGDDTTMAVLARTSILANPADEHEQHGASQ